MRKGSIKSTRINSEVQKELAVLIANEVKDPRIDPMTSVISCDVTTDLKQCRVYISILASDEQVHKDTMEGLENAKGFLRTRLAETVNLRNTPELIFKEDRGIEHAIHISQLISETMEKDRKNAEKRKENGEKDV